MVSAGRLQGKRIFVVEDEYFIASDLSRALAAEGANVIGPVGHIDKALSLAGEEAIDAAVLDVNLEGAPSYPLADRLAERGVPWVFVTGYDSWSMPPAYRASPCVAKPFATNMLVDTLAGFFREGHFA